MRGKTIQCAILIAALLASGTAHGQWGKISRDSLGMTGYVAIGANFAGLGELNDTLKGNGFPTAGSLAASWGGGMHGVWKNRIVFGTSYHRLFSKRGENDRYRTRLSRSVKMIDIGYPAYSGKNLQAYPLIGIGLATENLTVYPTGSVSFEEIMTDPGQGSNLSRQGLLIDIGVQASRFVMKRAKKQYSWGFRFGYRFVPAQRAWSLDGVKAASGPESGAEGPYLHFNFGMAGLIGAIRGKDMEEKEKPLLTPR